MDLRQLLGASSDRKTGHGCHRRLEEETEKDANKLGFKFMFIVTLPACIRVHTLTIPSLISAFQSSNSLVLDVTSCQNKHPYAVFSWPSPSRSYVKVKP